MKLLHIVFLFFATFLISCDKYNSTNKSVLRYNEMASITSLDPIYANTQSNIWATSQIFNTLVEIDNNMDIIPSIAKDWFISDNGLKYTFILEDSIYYHKSECFGQDSTRLLVASDFINSITRIKNKQNISPGYWVLDYLDLDKIHSVNDTLLEINLSKPFPGLLGLLTMNYFSFVPIEAVNYYGIEFSKNPIGTGPFIFKSWHQNEKIILLKNTNYFEFENGIRLPYLDAVSISFVSQQESVFMNFMLGKFDFLSGLESNLKDNILSHDGDLLEKYKDKFYLLSSPFLNTEYLGIHIPRAIETKSPLMFKNFRKALNHSFDRKKMIKYLRNDLVIPGNKGIVHPVLSNCYDIRGFHYSPDSVRSLLKDVPDFKEKIIINTTQDYLDICEFIRHSAEDFGIKIDIEISSPSVHRELVSSSQASCFRASWIADYPDPENYLSLFCSDNKSPKGPNYTHFSNQLFDSLYQESLFEINYIKRCELFRKMEGILIEESVLVPLYYDYSIRVVSNKISGMSINSMNRLSLKKVKKN